MSEWMPGDGEQEFEEARPELARLAPIAEAIFYVSGGVDKTRNRLEKLRSAWSALHEAHDLAEEVYPQFTRPLGGGTYEALADSLRDWKFMVHDQERAADEIENCGLKVDRETGKIRVPTGLDGKNPTLLTFAAGMIWESLDVDEYRERTGDTRDVPPDLAERVSERLWPLWVDSDPTRGPRGRGDLDPGRNTRLRRALRSYVNNPERYDPDLLPL